jgi:hypothetical protein
MDPCLSNTDRSAAIRKVAMAQMAAGAFKKTFDESKT